MSQNNKDDELVGMSVKVHPYIRYAFRDLAEHSPEGATKLMTELVEGRLQEQYGKYGIPMLKRDYEHTQLPKYDHQKAQQQQAATDEPGSEPS